MGAVSQYIASSCVVASLPELLLYRMQGGAAPRGGCSPVLLLACVCVCERERLLNARVSSHLDNTPEYMPSVSADDEAADERAHVLAPADEEDKHGFYMFGVGGDGLQLLRSWPYWAVPAMFAVTEFMCLVTQNASLLSLLTDRFYGDVERSLVMRVHVWSALTLWLLGALQMLGRRSLRESHPAVHKATGYLFLMTWALLVAPTSFYLSLLVQADAYTGTLCTMVLLDVTLLSGYFFWRAWRVARLRDSGRHSLALHAKLMSLGLFGTMSQLPQRCIMLLLMALRAVWATLGSHGASNNVHGRDRAPVVSDAALFSISMISSQAIFLFFLDGPRSPWIRRRIRHSMEGGLAETTLWGASERDEYEMYAYDPLTPSARWKWRSRIVVYALARGAVTGWWARSPPLA